MKKQIKIKLNYPQWELLQRLTVLIVKLAPIAEWELESYAIIDFYKRLMYRLTVWDPGGDNHISLSLKYSEAQAINNFWCCHSDDYNMLLRQLIEPKLPPAKEFGGIKTNT